MYIYKGCRPFEKMFDFSNLRFDMTSPPFQSFFETYFSFLFFGVLLLWGRECIRFFPSQKWRKCAIVRKVGKVFFITQQVVMFLFRWRTSLLYIWIILNHYISESFDDCWYHRAETEHSVTFSLKKQKKN